MHDHIVEQCVYQRWDFYYRNSNSSAGLFSHEPCLATFQQRRCTTKKLSKVLLKVFQLVSKTLKYHCQYKCKFLKTKSYWIIANSEDIHRDIKQLNNRKKASTIYSYDFTKLYTDIPYGMLRDNILYVIEEELTLFILIPARAATISSI